MNRRAFLGGLAAAGAVAALPVTATHKPCWEIAEPFNWRYVYGDPDIEFAPNRLDWFDFEGFTRKAEKAMKRAETHDRVRLGKIQYSIEALEDWRTVIVARAYEV